MGVIFGDRSNKGKYPTVGDLRKWEAPIHYCFSLEILMFQVYFPRNHSIFNINLLTYLHSCWRRSITIWKNSPLFNALTLDVQFLNEILFESSIKSIIFICIQEKDNYIRSFLVDFIINLIYPLLDFPRFDWELCKVKIDIWLSKFFHGLFCIGFIRFITAQGVHEKCFYIAFCPEISNSGLIETNAMHSYTVSNLNIGKVMI